MGDEYPEHGEAGPERAPGTRLGAWRRARLRAEQTPPTRNRYVDLLRAASIFVVVLGHWLMAAPTAESGVRFTLSDMLHMAPWTQWLTWIFQVMPLFFVVGGYANAASWASARTSGIAYGEWVSRRLQRLVRPVVPFVLVWCALALSGRWLGLSRGIVESGSRAAFIPTWFLAVYVLVVVLAPAMHATWRRWGLASFWTLVLAAAVVDTIARGSGVDEVRWANYVFGWLAIHQIGFAWRDGAFADSTRAISFALTGLAGLVVLVGLADYPVSMVTVPGETMANSNPPTLALLALAVTHAGILLAIEGPARRLLEARAALWATTVFVNALIMTLYLWHATVMVLIVGLAELPGGVGLRFVPDTATWWLTRLPWLVVLSIVLAAFVAVFGRVEGRRRLSLAHPPAWRSVLGAVALCAGLVILGAEGIGGEHPLGIRPVPVLLTLAGALLVTGGGGRARRDARSAGS